MKSFLSRFNKNRLVLVVAIIAAFLSVAVLTVMFWAIPIVAGVLVAERFKEYLRVDTEE